MPDPTPTVGVPPTPDPAPVIPGNVCPTCGNNTLPWYKDPENQKDIATALGVGMELFNAYQPHIPPGVSVGVGILLRAAINFFGGSK